MGAVDSERRNVTNLRVSGTGKNDDDIVSGVENSRILTTSKKSIRSSVPSSAVGKMMKFGSNRTETIGVRVAPETKLAVATAAADVNRSIASLVETILIDHLSSQGYLITRRIAPDMNMGRQAPAREHGSNANQELSEVSD